MHKTCLPRLQYQTFISIMIAIKKIDNPLHSNHEKKDNRFDVIELGISRLLKNLCHLYIFLPCWWNMSST